MIIARWPPLAPLNRNPSTDLVLTSILVPSHPPHHLSCEILWGCRLSRRREGLEGDANEQLFKSRTGCKHAHENAQGKCCRQIRGVHNKLASTPVVAELGRFPVSLKIVSQVVTISVHIISYNDDLYTRKKYTDMTQHQSVAGLHYNYSPCIRDGRRMGQPVHF